MGLMSLAELLAVNGPLHNTIDNEIRRLAREYAAKREVRGLDAAETTLDGAATVIVAKILDAVGETLVWAPRR